MMEIWAQDGYQMLAKQQQHQNCPAWSSRRGPVPQPSAEELLGRITVPVLILKQDEQGETRARSIAVAANMRQPASKLVHVEGAGHNVRRDQKERALAVLLPFLSAIEDVSTACCLFDFLCKLLRCRINQCADVSAATDGPHVGEACSQPCSSYG
jgi:hypothetical protein